MGQTRIALLLAVGASLTAGTSAGILAEAPKPKVEASATVTVTAEASPVELDKTPNPVKVIDGKAIQASGARTLDQLLETVLPGQLLPYGGPGTSSGLYLGGARAQDVVVLLDGIRITDPSGMSPSFSDFSLEGIDRVEILQGPASTRYGSDTHGGVVALYSAGPAKEGFSGNAMVGLGTRGIRKAQVSPTYGWRSGWVRAGVAMSEEEQSIPADDPFRTISTSLGLGQQIGEEGLLTLNYLNHYRSTPLPFAGTYASTFPYAYTSVFDASRENSQRDQSFIGTYRQSFGKIWSFEMSLGHVAQDRVEPGMNLGDPSDRYQGQRNQAVASLAWTPLKSFRASLLLDHSGEKAILTGEEAKGTHDAVALELSHEWDFGLRAVISGREQWDSLDYHYSDGTPLPDRDTSHFTYKAGLNWRLQESLRVYASYGTSYNAPALYQITHNLSGGYGDIGNERSKGAQVGISYANGPWSAKVEASRTIYDQIVAYVDLGNWAYRYENASGLRIQGVEGSLKYTAPRWSLEGFARSQEARNTSRPESSQFTSSGATGRPFFSGGMKGSATCGEWRFDARWTYIGSSYQYSDLDSSVVGTHTHYNDLALGLTWSPTKALSLAVKGEHLLQKAWSREDWLTGKLLGKNDACLVPNYPTQARTVTLEARYSF